MSHLVAALTLLADQRKRGTANTAGLEYVLSANYTGRSAAGGHLDLRR
jgi:hypothetical protein